MAAGTARFPAPAVHYPLRRSTVLGLALALLQGTSLFVLLAWWNAGAQPSAALAALLLWALAAGLSVRFFVRLPAGALVWDGQAWELHGAGDAGEPRPLGRAVVLQLDLQRWMAVSFPEARPTVWLFVQRSEDAVRWLDLRRAVYSPATASLSEAAAQDVADATLADRRL